jgi:hypothetical protein
MITIVSGLPRSGTSLAMQMLKAAGYPIFWNREPNVDKSNPRGYYEWEQAKKLWQATGETQRAIFEKVEARIVKIFPQCFPCLCPSFEYQIIYVDRRLDEVIASQRRMLAELSRDPNEVKRDFLIKLRFHARVYLKAFRSLELDHSELYSGMGAHRMERFLAGGLMSNSRVLAMNNCIDTELRHHLVTAA